MNILIISQFLVRDNQPGANRQGDFVKKLHSAGHNCEIITFEVKKGKLRKEYN